MSDNDIIEKIAAAAERAVNPLHSNDMQGTCFAFHRLAATLRASVKAEPAAPVDAVVAAVEAQLGLTPPPCVLIELGPVTMFQLGIDRLQLSRLRVEADAKLVACQAENTELRERSDKAEARVKELAEAECGRDVALAEVEMLRVHLDWYGERAASIAKKLEAFKGGDETYVMAVLTELALDSGRRARLV